MATRNWRTVEVRKSTAAITAVQQTRSEFHLLRVWSWYQDIAMVAVFCLVLYLYASVGRALHAPPEISTFLFRCGDRVPSLRSLHRRRHILCSELQYLAQVRHKTLKAASDLPTKLTVLSSFACSIQSRGKGKRKLNHKRSKGACTLAT